MKELGFCLVGVVLFAVLFGSLFKTADTATRTPAHAMEIAGLKAEVERLNKELAGLRKPKGADGPVPKSNEPYYR